MSHPPEDPSDEVEDVAASVVFQTSDGAVVVHATRLADGWFVDEVDGTCD